MHFHRESSQRWRYGAACTLDYLMFIVARLGLLEETTRVAALFLFVQPLTSLQTLGRGVKPFWEGLSGPEKRNHTTVSARGALPRAHTKGVFVSLSVVTLRC